jgi:sterol desaturase/sphingolipid hydroxylase (fatty acid hydroxylase superfamily)
VTEALLAHEASARFYLLVAAFGVAGVCEALAPRRTPAPPAGKRWAINLGLTVVSSVLIGLVYPVLAVSLAIANGEAGFGALHAVTLPHAAEFVLALAMLDAGRYCQHVLLHRVPLLWRLHRVHHSDPEYDTTTGFRFHPLEGVLVTIPFQLAVVALSGASAASVLVYEALVIVVAPFAHANLRLPRGVDAVLRHFVMTPDLHRVHHSAEPQESDRNFGAVGPWWDRLFRTYIGEPRAGHERMAIGLADVRDRRVRSVRWLLMSPFLESGRS